MNMQFDFLVEVFFEFHTIFLLQSKYISILVQKTEKIK